MSLWIITEMECPSLTTMVTKIGIDDNTNFPKNDNNHYEMR